MQFLGYQEIVKLLHSKQIMKLLSKESAYNRKNLEAIFKQTFKKFGQAADIQTK